jgi:hypothetical protein
MTDLITYNRSDRVYEVVHPHTGEIVERFPSKARHEALMYLIALFEPELYQAVQRIITRNPQFERRVWKAAELVMTGQVEILGVPVNNVVGKVAASDGYGRYNVALESGYLTCECADFVDAAAPLTESGARYCKHLLAYRLALLFEERF